MFSMKMCCVTFEEVISLENLCLAWREFIRGKRKKEDVQRFALWLGDELVMLHDELASGAYAHGAYHHFTVSDPKKRDIHKASVRDRLVHHAIHRKIYPYFAERFIADSFSCQTGKGMHRAIDKFRRTASIVSKNNTRTCWILKCDVRKFFASIDHDILIGILSNQIGDSRLMDLLERVIRSFEVTLGKGIPLGNLTSQLFANIYMNELDQFVKHRLGVKCYIRYADDFVFLSSRKGQLLAVLADVQVLLANGLALSLHPKKISIETLASGVDFLGWVHFPSHRVPRTKTKQRMLKRIKANPTNGALQSYLGLMKHGDAFELQVRLRNDLWYFS